MKLSHNITVGLNNFTITKLCKWRIGKIKDYYINDFDNLVEYLQELDFIVVDWDRNWLKVMIKNELDLNKFYNSILAYSTT